MIMRMFCFLCFMKSKKKQSGNLTDKKEQKQSNEIRNGKVLWSKTEQMASLTPGTPGNHIEATIPNTEQFDGVTLYNINITVGPVRWSVRQRYNAFSELHEKLVSNHGVARDLLPPKKIIGNKDPAFVEKRRGDLQLYLQLHAISHRLKNPLPTNVASEQETDFSHVADFASQVKYLVVEGSNEFHRTSNIVQNKLSYSLNTFQSVEKLAIRKARVSNIGHLGAVRRTTKSLVVNESEMKTMSDVLMCGAVYKETVEGSEPHIWALLTDVDVSFNDISKIDDSITLAPNIEKLNLSNNKLSSIDSLTSLPHLVSLNLSSNLFSELDEMHTKLGNVVELNLSQNNLKSLKGLGKLYSLTSLNVSTNNILEIVEVSHISRLPCLETLIITGNPVATVVDYRTKVLELFAQRASEICLDNERPTRRELDTVAVLQAIRASREGRLPTLSFSNPVPISTTTLAFVTPDIATAVSESSNND
ncbi:nischarin-like isoform X3 [Macrobrachium rosenbergii]|uniref:nischarin-like isoform X3 n=1 Tax=Macrobrachium rosenbergii TaxID=79674 RepID=UPI0034D65AFC